MPKTERPFLQRLHMFYERVLFEYHKLILEFPYKIIIHLMLGFPKDLKLQKNLSFAERFMSAYWEGWQSDLVMDVLHLVGFDPISSRNLISQYIITM